MTIEELKGKIHAILNASYSLQVYFILKLENGLELRLADFDSQETEPEIRALYSRSVNAQITNNEELEVCELSTADERANAIYHYDYADYPEELGLFRNFNICEAVKEIPQFNFSEDDLSTLFGYIIYLGSMSSGVVLFKKHYPISLIKRDTFLLGAIRSEHRFQKVTGDDIIRLNDNFQLIRVENEIFILDLNVLERNLGFTELIRKAATETIQEIAALSIIEDIQVLVDAAEDASFARKLSKITKESPIIRCHVSNDAIIAFSKTNPALVGMFKYNEDGSKIRLDTKKSKLAFIKLMNDVFLRSELTNQDYEAKAKDNVTSDN